MTDSNPIEFIRACSLKEVPKRRGKVVHLDEDRQVAVFNIDGNLYAVDNVCPHQHQPVIAEGYVENCTVTCPLHGWMYDLQTGRTVGGNGAPIRTYQIQLEGEDVMLEKPLPKTPRWMTD